MCEVALIIKRNTHLPKILTKVYNLTPKLLIYGAKHPLRHLGAVYTMDHEVGPWLYKAVDWLLKLSRDNFGLHQEKNSRGTMEVEVPKI